MEWILFNLIRYMPNIYNICDRGIDMYAQKGTLKVYMHVCYVYRENMQKDDKSFALQKQMARFKTHAIIDLPLFLEASRLC